VQAKKFSKAFQSHQVQRDYLAVVHGSLKPGFEGEVDSALRVDEDRVRLASEDDYYLGLEAKTKWRCLIASVSLSALPHSVSAEPLPQPTHSLLSLSPSTGRKHQLRIHCAEVLKGEFLLLLGYSSADFAPSAPIVGCHKYGPELSSRKELFGLSFPPDTILLHAASISFHVSSLSCFTELQRLTRLAYRPGRRAASERLWWPRQRCPTSFASSARLQG